ncbi:MAG: bifunctional pyr operon transcriptional regulator/uracil phosphoribosyltransferase PyrR [Pseudomonadota bacterium]|nr:bifunctional pyr operon transcriptional regulator/uracil phosphoribosyltransferase PyrR [Pseudomonadota bacterium]
MFDSIEEAIESTSVGDILASLSSKLKDYVLDKKISNPALIGIRRGGVWIGQILRQVCFPSSDLGELNIAYYRDDFSEIGLHPTVEPSVLPFDIDDRDVILFDDILYTGRTVRAAMNEIFDYGRPKSVILVVLLDRGGRELPIKPDLCGIKVELSSDYHVKLVNEDAMRLKVFERGK